MKARWAVFVALAAVIHSSAACPDGHPSVSQEFQTARLVVIGAVIARRTVPDSADGYFLDGDVYVIRIKQRLRGKASGRIEVFSENSTARFPMTTGEEYLLFLHRDRGRWLVDNCGNSDDIASASETLEAVRRQAAAKRPSKSR